MNKHKGFGVTALLAFSLNMPTVWAASNAMEVVGDNSAAANFPAPAIESVPVAAIPAGSSVLYDNGPFITGQGTGAGGADVSVLQTNLGMNTYGLGHQTASDIRVADDFTVPSEKVWQIDKITFYAYQTGSTTTSTFTAVNLRIWDGKPEAPGSHVVWGDDTTNVMSSSGWTGVYRVTDTDLQNNQRPIMANEVTVNTLLPEGVYWLDWQADGSLGSGPWAPPISILGQTTTGNAEQKFLNVWNPVVDSGAGTTQGFPFVIEGNVPSSASVPTLSTWVLALLAGLLSLLGYRLIQRKNPQV